MSKTFLTVAEAAAYFGVCKHTIYRLLEQGILPGIRLGPRIYRIPQAALDQLASAALAKEAK